ncbi:hypothetical protein, partial [Streptomyces capoamus]|uniref:hypothetical protein n=1 Tax=Streptomyces capoamus TaxID=68183 RepID=UPI003397DEA0
HGLGIETGVDLGRLTATSVWMAEQLGRRPRRWGGARREAPPAVVTERAGAGGAPGARCRPVRGRGEGRP